MKQEETRKNKEIIQSYVLTMARYESNIYTKRILTHIVSANQDYLEGVKMKGGAIINIDVDLFARREYTIDLKEILLGDTDKNYYRVKKAFHYLQHKFLRFDDEEDNYISVPFIMALKLEKGTGFAKFSMSDLVVKAFTDFTRGYRKLEFDLCLSFTSVYSIRMYELMAGQKKPLTYTIEEIKKMFCVEEKYKATKDFVRRVIEPAKKELDEKSPYSFEYKLNKKGRSFYSVTFHPVYQPQFRDDDLETKDLQRQVSLSWFMTQEEKKYLLQVFDFSEKELKNNSALFESAKKKGFSLILFLDKIKPRALRAENIQGYVINALKGELKELGKREQEKVIKRGFNHFKSTNNNEPTSIGDLLKGFKH